MSLPARTDAPSRPTSSGHRQSITACLIVLDEEERLPAALASVSWCDEIVVVDSGSSDRTVEIAEAAGARVVAHPWQGFGVQRNVCLDHATSTWVVEVDADERISAPLRADIERFLAHPPDDVNICVLPLRDRFLGAPLGASAKYPHYRARLFRHGTYRHDEKRLVHEGLWPDERTLAMKGDLEHEYASTWREAVADWWHYARLESGHIDPLGSVGAYVTAIALRPTLKIVFRLAVDGGWRDGWRGVVRIVMAASADSLVFTRRALGRVPEQDGPVATTFGRRLWSAGPVRVVVVDHGRASLPFLRAAHACGADVALVTDADVDGGDWMHVERVPRVGPLHVVRALDAISQMRPVDQLVVGRARIPMRLLPVGARGVVAPTRLAGADAGHLVEMLTRAARG